MASLTGDGRGRTLPQRLLVSRPSPASAPARARQGAAAPLPRRLMVCGHRPLSGRVHRLAPPAWAIVAAMDGTRTVDDIWTATAAAQGEAALTQDQVISLLGQLHAADLLPGRRGARHRGAVRPPRPPGAPEAVAEPAPTRWRCAFRLWNPDRFLDPRRCPGSARCSAAGGLALWLAAMLPALVLVAQHWPELTANLARPRAGRGQSGDARPHLSGDQALHELGHAFDRAPLRRRGARDGHHVPRAAPRALCRRLRRLRLPLALAPLRGRRSRHDGGTVHRRTGHVRLDRTGTRASPARSPSTSCWRPA